MSALTGLKATLPISFSQIWSRSCVSTGHLRPPATNAAGDLAAARAPLAAGLPDRVAGAFDVPDDARLDDLGRAVDHAADHRLRGDRCGDAAARVDRLEDGAFERPPCDWKYHQGRPFCPAITAAPGLSAAPSSGASAGQAVRLEPDEDDVGVGDRADVVGRLGMRLEVAARAQHPDASLLHRAQVRAAGDQRHVAAAAGERGADVGADRTGAEDREPHAASSESAAPTRLRCTLPVGVRGIASSTWTTSGTLNGGEPLAAVVDQLALVRVAARARRPRRRARRTSRRRSPKQIASATAGCASRTSSIS